MAKCQYMAAIRYICDPLSLKIKIYNNMITDPITFPIERVSHSRVAEQDFSKAEFGRVFSDHMLVADFEEGEWRDPKIVPYGDISLSPATSSLHYGQAVFEGMKAYKGKDGDTLLFRPYDNYRRLNQSAQRMCMPEVTEEIFVQGLIQLLRVDADWVPSTPGCSLYIRPFMFASNQFIGVRPSTRYRFIIFTCPVAAYYSSPLRVKVETQYVRSAEGAAGYAKAAGNYGSSLYPAQLAQQEGYHQLLWTDAKEHKYIEESGTMNVMFVIDGKLITPALSTSILAGITRDSVLQVARDQGLTVEERKISVDEIIAAHQAGTLQEAFGTGTAATITQIASIGYNGQDYDLPAVEQREVSNTIGSILDEIKTGQAADPHNWVFKV
jgi:branched-chain amino acid aminotransferase